VIPVTDGMLTTVVGEVGAGSAPAVLADPNCADSSIEVAATMTAACFFNG